MLEQLVDGAMGETKGRAYVPSRRLGLIDSQDFRDRLESQALAEL
jgi:hypothetical protein